MKLSMADIEKEKLTGLTTDGESANKGKNHDYYLYIMGKNSGLWARMKDYLEREFGA